MTRPTDVLSKLSSRALLTFVAYDCVVAAAGMGICAGIAISDRIVELALIDIYMALILGMIGALVFDYRRRELS